MSSVPVDDDEDVVEVFESVPPLVPNAPALVSAGPAQEVPAARAPSPASSAVVPTSVPLSGAPAELGEPGAAREDGGAHLADDAAIVAPSSVTEVGTEFPDASQQLATQPPTNVLDDEVDVEVGVEVGAEMGDAAEAIATPLLPASHDADVHELDAAVASLSRAAGNKSPVNGGKNFVLTHETEFPGESALAHVLASTSSAPGGGQLRSNGNADDDEFDYDMNAATSTAPSPPNAMLPSRAAVAAGVAAALAASTSVPSALQLPSEVASSPSVAPVVSKAEPVESTAPAPSVLADAHSALAQVRGQLEEAREAERQAEFAAMEARIVTTSELAASAPGAPATANGVSGDAHLGALAEGNSEEEEEEEEEEVEVAQGEGEGAQRTKVGGAHGPNATAIPPPTDATVSAQEGSTSGAQSVRRAHAELEPLDDERQAVADEFEAATALLQARAAAAAAAAATKGGSGARAAAAAAEAAAQFQQVTYARMAAHLRRDDVLQPLMADIVPAAVDPEAGCFGKMFAPKLLPSLHAERNTVFATARLQYDATDETHRLLFTTLFTQLTRTPATSHAPWTLIGFQREDDYSTDLRGCGMLGPLQPLYLLTTWPRFAAELYATSVSELQPFPFMAQSISISARALQSLRYGKAYRACNSAAQTGAGAGTDAQGDGPVWRTFHKLYAALYFHFYELWKGRGATIRDMGVLMNDVVQRVNADVSAALARFDAAMQRPPFAGSAASAAGARV